MRHHLLADTALAQKNFSNARIASIDDLFADLASNHPSIWADEQAAVSQAATTQQTVHHAEGYLLDLAKADADRDQALRDADAAKTLQNALSNSQLENATAQANDAFAQFKQSIAANANGANAATYHPWHVAANAGPSAVRAADFTRPTFVAANAPTADGYFSSAVSAMFGFGLSNYPSYGSVPLTPAEQTALTERVGEQSSILDHRGYPSPVDAGPEEATPVDFWQTTTAALTPAAQAGLTILQSQYGWGGFAGVMADGALQSLLAVAIAAS